MTAARDLGLLPILQQTFACAPAVAARLDEIAKDRRWAEREEILAQDRACQEAFLLLSGRARARLFGLDGHETLIQDFSAGDLFGALESEQPEPYGAEVVALEPCRAAVFGAAEFEELLEAHGSIGLAVTRMLSRQLAASSRRLMERTSLSAAGRVHAALLRLGGEGRRIASWPSPTALAPEVQSTRETVSRTLNALERRGIIRREGAALVIAAPRRLEELVV